MEEKIPEEWLAHCNFCQTKVIKYSSRYAVDCKKICDKCWAEGIFEKNEDGLWVEKKVSP